MLLTALDYLCLSAEHDDVPVHSLLTVHRHFLCSEVKKKKKTRKKLVTMFFKLKKGLLGSSEI